MKKILCTTLLALGLSACSVNHGTFTVISNQVADLDNLDLSTSQKVRNVKGESIGHIVIVIPVGELNPNVESAMTDAFTKVDGDVFTNARVSAFWFYIPYLLGRFQLDIEGDVIKTRK